MSRIKMALMAMVAVFAIGAVGASAASAATGTGSAVVTVGTSCTVGFNWDTGTGNPAPPSGTPATLSGFAASGCTASINEPPTSLTVQFNAGGVAVVNGLIDVTIFGVDCQYAVNNVQGTWTNPPLNVTGSGNISLTQGDFLCPDDQDFSIDADFTT